MSTMEKLQIVRIQQVKLECDEGPHKFETAKVYSIKGKYCAICPVHQKLIPVVIKK